MAPGGAVAVSTLGPSGAAPATREHSEGSKRCASWLKRSTFPFLPAQDAQLLWTKNEKAPLSFVNSPRRL